MYSFAAIAALILLLPGFTGTALARSQRSPAPVRNSKTSQVPLYDAQHRPVIQALSAILVDANTGKVLFSKDPDKELPPASTTKIMTALLVLEHGKLDETVTVSEHVTKTPTSSLHLVKGEKISIRNLLYGALIRSANDACVAMGEHIAGSESAFVEKMNRRAKELGAKHTHFVTCSGLHDPKHYSSARDLSIIARRAIEIPLFNEIVITRKAILVRSINQQDLVVFNHNRLLKQFDGADGIKTGFTKEAGRCLVGSATRNGWRLISVVLNSPDVIGETERLLNYGFQNYARVMLARKGEFVEKIPVRWGTQADLSLVAGDDLTVIFPRNGVREAAKRISLARFSLPIQKGQCLGTLYAEVDGRRIGSVPLIAASDVGRSRSFLLFIWIAGFTVILVIIRGARRNGRTPAKSYRRRRNRFTS